MRHFKTTLFIISLLLASCLLCFTPCAASAQTAEPAAVATIAVSVQDWTALQESWAAQEKALAKSEQELTAARSELAKSAQELSEARELLQILSESSSEATKRAARLKVELIAQRQQAEQLQAELTGLQTASQDAVESLKTANEFLQNTKNDLIKLEKNHQRQEKKLRGSRNFWRVVAIMAVCFAAGR